MSWEYKWFDTAQPGKDLSKQIDALLNQQRKEWRAFRTGTDMLSKLRKKVYRQGRSYVVVQANPGRKTSIGAEVDPLSISQRPCFLCEENMPAEERCIGFDGLGIFPNPFPIQPRHLTIPIHEHIPQRIRGRLDTMLKLALLLGPRMLVFYNGARCGASAPDHSHFQACSNAGVPLLDDLRRLGNKIGVYPFRSFGRKILICIHPEAGHITDFVYQALDVMSSFDVTNEEPLINFITFFREEHYYLVLIPRARHRPSCYYEDGEKQIKVSPATLEMAGLLVLANIHHFYRLTEKVVAEIYKEVSINETQFIHLVKTLK